jgi:hypothetical protein
MVKRKENEMFNWLHKKKIQPDFNRLSSGDNLPIFQVEFTDGQYILKSALTRCEAERYARAEWENIRLRKIRNLKDMITELENKQCSVVETIIVSKGESK